MTLRNLAAILDPTAPDDRPLIIELSPDGDEQQRLSYGEGRRRVAALARGLLRRGLKRGEAVAIVAANSADYLMLYMATMAAGLVSVCVNHKLPRETVAHIMMDSAVKLAVADAERAPLVAELVPTVPIEQLDSGGSQRALSCCPMSRAVWRSPRSPRPGALPMLRPSAGHFAMNLA
jgi:long-chain acyl-CoA synthetase